MMAPVLSSLDFPILVVIMLVGLVARYGWRGGNSSRGPS